MKKKISKRGFLNKKEGIAIFEWSVDEGEGQFVITDCSRNITLYFSLGNWWNEDFIDENDRKKELKRLEDNYKDNQYKINQLRQQFTDFELAMEEFYKYTKDKFLKAKIISKKQRKEDKIRKAKLILEQK
jgi:hypothetical protein